MPATKAAFPKRKYSTKRMLFTTIETMLMNNEKPNKWVMARCLGLRLQTIHRALGAMREAGVIDWHDHDFSNTVTIKHYGMPW
jgi:hypothetical protein